MNKTKIGCACGCGCLIEPLDGRGRAIRFKKGHRIGTGRYTDKRGYVWVVIPGTGKKRQEHRVVMESILGRGLLSNERVHHISGEKNDNRPENLMLMDVRQHNHLHRPPLIIPEISVECACGCGTKINKFDARGRERKYLSPSHAWKKPHGRGNPNRKKVGCNA